MSTGPQVLYCERTFRSLSPILWGIMGNQADMTESSLCQSSNIGIDTSMFGLSYPKIRSSEIKPNAGNAHRKKCVRISVIIRKVISITK